MLYIQTIQETALCIERVSFLGNSVLECYVKHKSLLQYLKTSKSSWWTSASENKF